MRAAKLVACCLAVASLGLLVGCGGYMEYLQRSTNPNLNASTETRYQAQGNYQVLGTVDAQGEATCILGIVVSGKMGQGLLWQRARERYAAGFTGIKDICAMNEFQGILPPLYAQIKTTYSGTVVREAGAASVGAFPMQPPQQPANP